MTFLRGIHMACHIYIFSEESLKSKKKYFILLYRMYPNMAMTLIELLQDDLRDDPCGVPPFLQVLATVRFLAEGPYQKGLGTDLNHSMSQTCISKYLRVVIPAINRLSAQFIRFPSTPEERDRVQRR